MKREKGNIKKKIVIMLLAFAIVTVASNGIALVGIRNMQSSAADISNTYLEMEKEYGRIGKNVEILQKYINIMVVYPDEALAGMGDMYGNIENGLKSIETDIAEMEKHAEQTGNKTLVKTFQAYASGIRGQAILIRQCSQKRQQGDMEGAAAMVGTSILESIMGQEELDVALEAEIDETVTGTQNRMNRQSELGLITTLVMGMVCLVVMVFIYVVLNREIVVPAVQAKKKLDQIIIDGEEGRLDLSQRIHVKSKNEIGQLVGGINVFLDTLENVIGVIKTKSYGMQSSVEIMDTNIYDIHSEVADLSSVMEELSAGTEEISSSATFINESVQEVSQGIRGITDEVKEGTQFVSEIRERADYIEKMTVKSKNNTDSIVTEIAQALEVCIENSRSVEKINELTETILSIASQTNLLALNAAIEAARAGEAGRGFAVVAEEITQLAEDSRVTANAIQGINETVTSAVRDLNAQATKMVDFMKESVLPDYNSFEDMSKQYQRDADEVNTLLDSFYTSATNLDQAMGKIAGNIQSITTSMDESAKGVQMSTHNVVTLTEKMEIIGRESENSMGVAHELQDTAGKFVSAEIEKSNHTSDEQKEIAQKEGVSEHEV